MQISLITSRQISAPVDTAPVPPTTPPTTPPVVAPLFDFPGIVAGTVFDIAKGSKVGFITPKGTTSVDQFDAQAATFHIKAGAFGVNVDMIVAVKRLTDTQVELTSTKDGASTKSIGNIVAARTNFAEFVSTDGKNEHTVIARDAKTGVILLDAVVPTFGNAHLVLQPKKA